MSIKLKLISLVFSTMFVAAFISGYIIYRQVNEQLTMHFYDMAEGVVGQTAQLTNIYIGQISNDLAQLANAPEVISALETEDKNELDKVSRMMTSVDNFSVAIGTIALQKIKGHSCIVLTGATPSIPLTGTDMSDRDYCRGVVETKGIYLSSAYKSDATKNIVLGLAVPVRNTKGEMRGFVMAAVNLNELRGYLRDIQRDSKVELLDRNGVMFMDTEDRIETLGSLSPEVDVELGKIKRRLVEYGPDGVFRDEDTIIGYKNDGQITTIYEKPSASFFSIASSINMTIFLITVMAAFIISVILYVKMDSITRAISRLIKMANDIAGGQYSARSNMKGSDSKNELVVLGTSLDKMARTLEDNKRERNKREKNLKEALDLSEKYNRLATGRELEMIKLKNRIKELEEKKSMDL